jgi:hypothetical protein
MLSFLRAPKSQSWRCMSSLDRLQNRYRLSMLVILAPPILFSSHTTPLRVSLKRNSRNVMSALPPPSLKIVLQQPHVEFVAKIKNQFDPFHECALLPLPAPISSKLRESGGVMDSKNTHDRSKCLVGAGVQT